MSMRASLASAVSDDSVVAAVAVDVRRRWNALALSERVIEDWRHERRLDASVRPDRWAHGGPR
jgi:hypothetical protein